MTQAATAIPADVRERVIAAAADLFEQSGRQTMPTVDAVRRAARVDMNAASAVMKEWRRAQTAQAAPVAVAVPESVQQASSAAVATIWQQAQELADVRQQLAEAVSRADKADARIAEIEHRAADLRAELVKVQAKAEAIEQTHAEQRKQAATEAHRAAERLTKAQGERDDATKTAAEARERAAGLAGQLQAMQEQNAALLAAINPQGEQKPKKTPPAKA